MAKKEVDIENFNNTNLTLRQLRFCHEYVRSHGKITHSARYAGYSPDTASAIGSENLKKPQIRAYIEQFQKDVEDAAKTTYEWKVGVLRDLVKRGLMTEDDAKLQISAITGAIGELNRMGGHHQPTKVENKHAVALSDNPDDMSKMLDNFESTLEPFYKDF